MDFSRPTLLLKPGERYTDCEVYVNIFTRMYSAALTGNALVDAVQGFLSDRGHFVQFSVQPLTVLLEVIDEVAPPADDPNSYPRNEVIGFVLWMFAAIFPMVEDMDAFIRDVAGGAATVVQDIPPGWPTPHEFAILQMQIAHDKRTAQLSHEFEALRVLLGYEKQQLGDQTITRSLASGFRRVLEIYSRREAHLSNSRTKRVLHPETPSMALECVIAEGLAVDLSEAWKVRGKWPLTISVGGVDAVAHDAVQNELGFSYQEEVHQYDLHDQFTILRGDLDKLCPEKLHDYVETMVKPALKRMGQSNLNQEFWECHQWADCDLDRPPDPNVLSGMDQLIPEEAFRALHEEKRLQIWRKLATGFQKLLENTVNIASVASILGKGILFVMSQGKLARLRHVNPSLVEQICKAFSSRIPEIRKLDEKVRECIILPGMIKDGHLFFNRREYANERARPQFMQSDILEGHLEHVRWFYETLHRGGQDQLSAKSDPVSEPQPPAHQHAEGVISRQPKVVPAGPVSLAADESIVVQQERQDLRGAAASQELPDAPLPSTIPREEAVESTPGDLHASAGNGDGSQLQKDGTVSSDLHLVSSSSTESHGQAEGRAERAPLASDVTVQTKDKKIEHQETNEETTSPVGTAQELPADSATGEKHDEHATEEPKRIFTDFPFLSLFQNAYGVSEDKIDEKLRLINDDERRKGLPLTPREALKLRPAPRPAPRGLLKRGNDGETGPSQRKKTAMQCVDCEARPSISYLHRRCSICDAIWLRVPESLPKRQEFFPGNAESSASNSIPGAPQNTPARLPACIGCT